MRIKKKDIRERINPDVVAKQTRDVVDAVKGELKSDDDTAVDFIKGMTGGNVSEDGENRGISLEQTKDVADFLAKALSIVTGHQHTIGAGLKPGMFDLDMHGSPNNAGGSYKAYSNGYVIRPGFKGSPMVYNFKTDKGVGAIEKRYNNYMYPDTHPETGLDEDSHTVSFNNNMKKREIFFEGLRIGNETNPDTFRGNLSGNRIAIRAWDEYCARNRDVVSEDENQRAGRAIDYGTKEPELGVQVDRNMPKTGGIDFDEKDSEPDLPFEGKKNKKVVEGRKVIKRISIKQFKK